MRLSVIKEATPNQRLMPRPRDVCSLLRLHSHCPPSHGVRGTACTANAHELSSYREIDPRSISCPHGCELRSRVRMASLPEKWPLDCDGSRLFADSCESISHLRQAEIGW